MWGYTMFTDNSILSKVNFFYISVDSIQSQRYFLWKLTCWFKNIYGNSENLGYLSKFEEKGIAKNISLYIKYYM